MRLFLDACTLIYRFEGAALFRDATTALIAQLTAGQDTVELAVSRLSVMECRVKPLREGDARLLQRYADFFAAVQVIDLSAAVLDMATHVRAHHGLKTPDALQAACALEWQQQTPQAPEVLFITADQGFLRVPTLQARLIAVPA
ncbi:MAG: VapC toxin family PIN domain ribonuclease [Burkholderiales bacterium PBB3]|nr:MAG: VapC toxin family PIN domain ribonuclease [Burkholderiales bacterium PBB3]